MMIFDTVSRAASAPSPAAAPPSRHDRRTGRACRAAGRALANAGRPELCDGMFQETGDAIGQVVDDEQDHHAEDGGPVVGDLRQQQREDIERNAQRHRNGDAAQPPRLAASASRRRQTTAITAIPSATLRNRSMSGEQVRQEYDDAGADDRPQPGFAAAEGDRQQELDGFLETEVVRREIDVRIREQDARRAPRRPALATKAITL